MKQLMLCLVFAFSLVTARSQNCSTSITVNGPDAPPLANETFTFSVDVRGLSSGSISYNWSISMGTIVAGQGTPSITVDAGKGAGYCTATIEIGGLPENCNRSGSASVEIKAAPEKILEINTITNKTVQDAVKSFIKQLSFTDATIAQDALINIYAVDEKDFNRIKTMIDKAFESHIIFSYRYNVVNAGIKKTASITMFRIKK